MASVDWALVESDSSKSSEMNSSLRLDVVEASQRFGLPKVVAQCNKHFMRENRKKWAGQTRCSSWLASLHKLGTSGAPTYIYTLAFSACNGPLHSSKSRCFDAQAARTHSLFRPNWPT